MGKLSGSIRNQSSGIAVDVQVEALNKTVQQLEKERDHFVERLMEAMDVIDTLDTVGSVKQFHTAFGHSLGEDCPSDKITTLRINLIFEELAELAAAMGRASYDAMASNCQDFIKEYKKNNRVTIEYNEKDTLDALCDLRYVCDGTIISTNMESVFPHAFTVVHNSNMSKACFTEEQVANTLTYYDDNDVEVYLEWVDLDGKKIAIVKRTEDDKILKCIDYIPANFSQVLRHQPKVD